MMPKIFISSTYYDLIPFRKELWDSLIDIDVDILGMEQFGARSSTPLETCLHEVSRSDVYVGIIAYRYGSIDKESKKSFTQLEYERALDCNKEILIYFFDENSMIKPKFIDFGVKGNKLIKFKKLLRKNHTIDTFANPNDLSKKIYDKLQEVIHKLPKKFIRPQILESKLYRFSIDNDSWMAFVGYLDNLPVEIFVGLNDTEMYPIPTSIKKGHVKKVNDDDGNTRYDFIYIDKYGYKNTLGGLNYVFSKQMTYYNKIITSLLRNFTPLKTVFEAIDDMTLDEFENPDDWKKGIKEALSL